MKIKMITFSGTGNTSFIAELVSKKLESLGHSVEIVSDLNSTVTVDSETIIGVGFPVFDLVPPWVLMEYLEELPKVKGNRAFVFSTYTTDPLDTNSYVVEKLNEKGFKVIASEHFKCPGASAFFYSNPEHPFVKDKAVFPKETKEKVDSFAWDIEISNEPLEPDFHRFNKVHQFMSKLIWGNLFYRNLKVDNKCNQCKKCIKVCPTGNLTFKENKVAVHKKTGCLSCLKCIYNCPKGSINFTSAKRRGVYNSEAIEKCYEESLIPN